MLRILLIQQWQNLEVQGYLKETCQYFFILRFSLFLGVLSCVIMNLKFYAFNIHFSLKWKCISELYLYLSLNISKVKFTIHKHLLYVLLQKDICYIYFRHLIIISLHVFKKIFVYWTVIEIDFLKYLCVHFLITYEL